MDAAAGDARVERLNDLGVEELLGDTRATFRGVAEAEEALRLVSERCEHTEDPAAREDLAAEALDHVERQLKLVRERRRQLDSTEGKLWSRRNRIERFLIGARGSDWWRSRRNGAPMEKSST